MSLSRQYSTTKRANYKRQYDNLTIVDDKAFLELHWTEQLRLRPLRTQYRRSYNRDGDFDNLIDNFDDNEIPERKDT